MSDDTRNTRIEGGERPGFREAMDRMQKNLVESGNDPAYARRVAQRAAIRHDTGEAGGTTGKR